MPVNTSATTSLVADKFAAVRVLDRLREVGLAKATFGISPESMFLAWADWAVHLAVAPGKRIELALQWMQVAAAYLGSTAKGGTALKAPEAVMADPRFTRSAWQKEPFRQWAWTFLLNEEWWRHATRDVPGVDPHHEDVVTFTVRQWLDMLSPSNQLWTNPEVVDTTLQQGGMNLWRGWQHIAEDVLRKSSGLPPAGCENFVIGRDLACTPGKVVMRNRLVELIQYSPTTPTVHAEPVLLVSAWIMKFYVLDLSPRNSLVRWLVEQGHTVFCLSWRNVTAADRDLSMDDYLSLGLMAALHAIGEIVPKRKVHALGYCLGGTLLSIAAAAMARAGDNRLASVSLLAAQTDFTEPGELQLFIDPSQVHMLDSMMWQRGYLLAEQMSGAFQMLRSNDLIWSRMVHDYLLGERAPMIDLMAWNADSTRMPEHMHSEYLHHLFLGNDLAAGRYMVHGHPIAIQNIRAPIFALGTHNDHVAPWRSVYKIHYLADTEVTFVLTNGGHNAGVVNEPGHPHRQFRWLVKAPEDPCLSADEWQTKAQRKNGSWWPMWQDWLVRHSSPERVAPPPMGSPNFVPLVDAPGTYVMQR